MCLEPIQRERAALLVAVEVDAVMVDGRNDVIRDRGQAPLSQERCRPGAIKISAEQLLFFGVQDQRGPVEAAQPREGSNCGNLLN